MTTNQHIASYLSQRGDYEVIVTLLRSGHYAVRIYDVDADEMLPAVAYFVTEAEALAYALMCAASGDDEEIPV